MLLSLRTGKGVSMQQGRVLRSCLNIDRSWIGDVGDNRYLLVLIGDDWQWVEFKQTLASALMLHPQ